eukprot:1155839-Pleurochrysis_carterae.AAC.1
MRRICRPLTIRAKTCAQVSGWWGLARKVNYTGDWLMGLSWSLCCGAVSPVARRPLLATHARALSLSYSALLSYARALASSL